MPGRDIDVVETLRLELKLIELGFYRVPTPGPPLSVFEDSPICPRYGAGHCPDCGLMQFVPSKYRSELVPCHHIPLNEAGETVDSLYRTGTREELEEALQNWLTATIKRFEQVQNAGGIGVSSRKLAGRREKLYEDA
jgi:hypothetical protein